jgi:Tfp pilus assembly protein PilX
MFDSINRTSFHKGSLLIQVVAFMTIGVFIVSGLVQWAALAVRSARHAEQHEQAMQIAEAGIEYYRWHLAHAPTDFQDGTATSGPYIHDFFDKGGVKIGTFTLTITPPPTGSTLVTVRSSGKILTDTAVMRTIETKFAKPSLAKYAVVANADMRFGAGTEVFGPIHANGGIRFDGLAHNIISSARTSYDDPDHNESGADPLEFGVHTHIVPNDPLPPAAVPSRTDVFQTGRQFPVPAFDFTGLTGDLAQMKTDAQANGRYYAASGGQGYYILLKTNDTFDIYRVNAIAPPGGGCDDSGQTGWGTWSINGFGSAKTSVALDVPFPSNGLIFAEDHLWVDGQINSARLTIVAATFPDSPATRKSITVNNDLLYTNYDGQDVLALIAQGNFNVGMQSAATLRIDAALIAQNGRTGRYYYESGCSPYHARTMLTLYGMIATNQRYGFAYTDGTGYATRNIVYDVNLLYSPPPSFPLTTSQYQIISWDEI